MGIFGQLGYDRAKRREEEGKYLTERQKRFLDPARPDNWDSDKAVTEYEEQQRAAQAIEEAQRDLEERERAKKTMDQLGQLDFSGMKTTQPPRREYAPFEMSTPGGQVGGRGRLTPDQERRAGLQTSSPTGIDVSGKRGAGLEALADQGLADIMNRRGLTSRYSTQPAVGNYLKTVTGSEKPFSAMGAGEEVKAQFDQVLDVIGNDPNLGPDSQVYKLMESVKDDDELMAAMTKKVGDIYKARALIDRDVDRFGALRAPKLEAKIEEEQAMRPEKVQTAIETAAGREGVKKSINEPRTTASDEQGLRKEFQANTKDFVKVRDAYNRVKAASDQSSAAGDLALIFNYMKMLDPGSVVRESEFANAAATGSLGERFIAAGQKLLEGERLSPEMRRDFVDRSDKLFNQQVGSFNKLREYYNSLAAEYGYKPDRITGGLYEEPNEVDEDEFNRIMNQYGQ